MSTLEKLKVALDNTYDKYTIVKFEEAWDRALIVVGNKLFEIKFELEFTSLFKPTELNIRKIQFIKRVGWKSHFTMKLN